jgi:hypothetical protein
MNCNEMTELAPLYISGELESESAAQFEAHLKGCGACRAEIEAQNGLDARLRGALLAEEVDVSRINRRVRGMIAADAAQPVPPQVQRKSRRWVTAPLGIAASLLLLAAGYVLFPGRVARVYADAASDHRVEVVDQQPRRWVSDPAGIKALAEKQGIPGSVPVTLASGYRLERAKICWLDRRSFLHLVYSNGTGEFSLYLRAREGNLLPGAIRGIANGRLLHASSAGSENVSSFETPQLIAVVVTDQPADAAQRFAKAVSAAI